MADTGGWGEVRPSEPTGPSGSRLDRLHREVVADPSNAWATAAGYLPLYAVSEGSRIVIVGQAPGRKAQRVASPGTIRVACACARGWGCLKKSSTILRASPCCPWTSSIREREATATSHLDETLPPPGIRGFCSELADVRLMVLVGSYAQRHYLAASRKSNLTETVRCFEEYLPDYLPIVHPSPLNFRWQTKNPWFEATLLPRLRMIVKSVLNGG